MPWSKNHLWADDWYHPERPPIWPAPVASCRLRCGPPEKRPRTHNEVHRVADTM